MQILKVGADNSPTPSRTNPQKSWTRNRVKVSWNPKLTLKALAFKISWTKALNLEIRNYTFRWNKIPRKSTVCLKIALKRLLIRVQTFHLNAWIQKLTILSQCRNLNRTEGSLSLRARLKSALTWRIRSRRQDQTPWERMFIQSIGKTPYRKVFILQRTFLIMILMSSLSNLRKERLKNSPVKA